MFDKKGQGATEYLLMLAAVLVIVAAAIYYVTSTGGYPAVAATAGVESDNQIIMSVETGEIAAGEWQYSVSPSEGDYTWQDTPNTKLSSPSVTLTQEDGTGTWSAGTYYVSLRHVDTGHIYFSDKAVTTE